MLVLHGTGSEYVWGEADKISNVSSEETTRSIVNENGIREIECDWTKVYGELTEGEYEFVLITEDFYSIRIKFNVDKNGEVEYSNVVFT